MAHLIYVTQAAWMDTNPNDVVTVLLVNSDNASPSDLSLQFEAANITSYTYTPPTTSTAIATWPTLESLIANGTRLMTFVASLDPSTNTATPYLMDEFTFIWENPYDVTSLSNFSCIPERPAAVDGNIEAAVSSGRMALMNHFLDEEQGFGIEIPDIGNISITNAPSGGTGNLGGTAANCTALWGKPPNYILVDFFDQGPAITTVDKLNGITPVGRTGPTASQMASATSAASPRPTTMSGCSTRSWTWATGVAAVLVWCFM
ncbi:PLC-like phosphodiesterase, TIM beta/alpha-barrel domain [Lasallia pustulata]|uniref:PLC-like phosphodiesterase, TIM beta/alpha-barrel domain n=1 Tax=Lasallia pustulata TaxID=136370 RepID=A0A1W5D2Z6_9LECA|nr:PLC-like phosphodiesterase, TIM beta/alpha-barrel domain [Lasallia pustulata]